MGLYDEYLDTEEERFKRESLVTDRSDRYAANIESAWDKSGVDPSFLREVDAGANRARPSENARAFAWARENRTWLVRGRSTEP